MQNLSKRLKAVASLVKKGSSVADVGTDHGYIPVYLIENDIVSSAIAMDINEKPLASCQALVKSKGLENKIQTRLSNGLENLKRGECDTVIIPGDDLKNKGDNVVALIAGVNGEKANLVAVCGKEAIAKGVKAGDLVREIAKMAGGGGGGRPDSAMAGAKDISKLDSAISAVEDTVKSLIK